MYKVTTLLAISAIAVSGCAKRPDAIAPVTAPAGAYQNLSCTQSQQERMRLGQSLAALEVQQNNTATGDAIGVFLIGLPLGSVGGGDVEGQIAAQKGQVQALDMRLMSCRGDEQ
jgi:hypothetical protein